MDLTEAQLAAFIQQYFLPFVRIGMMFMVMPVIGSKIVSARVRLTLAALISAVVAPFIPELPKSELISFVTLGYVVQELAVGLVAGFTFQIIFQMFVLSGQYMAMKMGLGFASMNDPTNGVQTTVISQLFLMLVTLMFVSVDGHLVIVGLLVKSFQSLPPGSFMLETAVFWKMASMGTWMFSASLVLALPVLTSILFINVAFGVMSRAAPQLNIFAVGFPFTLICGLVLIWLGLSNFTDIFYNAMDFGFDSLRTDLKVK